MGLNTNTLYPVNYVEPAPEEPPPDNSTNARDFARLRQIIRGAVPEGGEPMTIKHLKRLVWGAPNRGGGMVSVADDSPAACRAAALNLSMGIEADPTVQGITNREALAVFEQIWAERQPTWTPYEPSE